MYMEDSKQKGNTEVTSQKVVGSRHSSLIPMARGEQKSKTFQGCQELGFQRWRHGRGAALISGHPPKLCVRALEGILLCAQNTDA